VGRIFSPEAERLGTNRLIGPIFARSVIQTHDPRSSATVHEMPVFIDGFAAVEGEYLVRIGADAPAGKVDWSAEDALAIIASIHVGLEIASSRKFPSKNARIFVQCFDFKSEISRFSRFKLH
jgi:2-keto-4-pentenoate hydratase